MPARLPALTHEGLKTPRSAALAGIFALLYVCSIVLIRLSVPPELADHGSWLLFLAMTFVAAALAGGLLATHTVEGDRLIDNGSYTLVRAVIIRITSGYAVKMVGVFMLSLATISIRTGVMPRWLRVLTYVLALGLLLSIGSSPWVVLILPAWVCAVSRHILASNLAARPIERAQPLHTDPP